MKRSSALKQLARQIALLDRSVSLLKQELRAGKDKRRLKGGEDRHQLIMYLALSPTLSEDETLQHLLRCVMRVVNAGGAALTLLDAKKRRLVFRAASGDGADGIVGQEVPLQGSRHGLAFATGEVQAATPIYKGVEDAAKTSFRNVLVAPLIVAHEPIGTMSAVNKIGADHFTPQDMSAMKLFADLAAMFARQRSREEILQRGLSTAKNALGLRLTLTPDERELLKLFEQLTRVKAARPELLQPISKFVQQLNAGVK
jgi:GAF domain-containing protein